MLRLNLSHQIVKTTGFHILAIVRQKHGRKCISTPNEKKAQPGDQDVALVPLSGADIVGMLSETGAALNRNVECVAAGRTSLVLQGMRQFTFYVDLVFLSEDDLSTYIEGLKSIGYSLQAYGKWLRFVKKMPIDLWLNRTYLINASMLKRSKRLEENTDKLAVGLLHPQDILILDVLSWNTGDLDDVKTIIDKTTVDWSLLLSEIKERMTKGVSRRFPLAVAYTLDKLQTKGVRIPESISNEISQILSRQDLRGG